MADNMLLCFDSPMAASKGPRNPRTLGMMSPLIPCPTLPFDIVTENAVLESDPFEKVLKSALQQARASSLPVSPTSPKFMRGLPMESDLDISAAMAGRRLISSTPNQCGRAEHKVRKSSLPAELPGTPTKYNTTDNPGHTPRRALINQVMETSADQLEAIIQNKMARLHAINQNLSSANRSNLRRSLSTPDLPKGLRTNISNIEPLNSFRDSTFLNVTPCNYGSVMNLTQNQKAGYSPIKPSLLKKEAQKLSLLFQNITVTMCDSDDGLDDSLLTPVKKKKDKYSRSLLKGKGGVSPSSILREMPPWDFEDSSSEDEDGLPKIMRVRLSASKDPVPSPDTESIIKRYKKARSSLKFDDEPQVSQHPCAVVRPKEAEALPNCNSTQIVPNNVPEPIFSKAPVVELVPPPPIPEKIITDLKPKNTTTNIVKKGPLKAVVPLPSMIKTALPSKMQITKPRSSSISTSTPLSSRDKPVGGDLNKGLPPPLRRSNSGSALTRKVTSPKKVQNLSTPKSRERPSSAQSPCKGLLENRPTARLGTGKGPMLKNRPVVAPGKENLIKK